MRTIRILTAAVLMGILIWPCADLRAQDDHEDHSGEGVRLTAEQARRFGIKMQVAGPGILRNEIQLPGEVGFNEDRLAHLVPAVSGIARVVNKTVGDRVTAGEVLAVIESRELAATIAGYLEALARRELAKATFEREDGLYGKKISSEQDYLDAKTAFAEARIVLRASEQELFAIGLEESDLALLENRRDASISRYEIKSPISGRVVEKHITRGETVGSDSDIFTVADLNSVWVNLTIYLKDLNKVRENQRLVIKSMHSDTQAEAGISMVTPFVSESTRSGVARVELDNSAGGWIPGTFVTAHIADSTEEIAISIVKVAVQTLEEGNVVFRRIGLEYVPMPVTIGRSDGDRVEILSGIEPGQSYVAEGAFELKAAIVTSSLDSHAGHGH